MNQLPLPTDLGTFITWIGSDAVIGAVLVFLWNWDVLKELKTWIRLLILVVVGAALAIGSYLGIAYIPAGVVDQLQPYYRIVVMVITIIAGILGTNALRLVYQNFTLNQEIKVKEKQAHLRMLAAGPHG